MLALTCGFHLRRNSLLRFYFYVDFDCAGSHKVCVMDFSISKGSFYRVSYTFSDINFICMAAARNPSRVEVRNMSLRGRCKESGAVKIMAGAVFRGRCQNVGRRVSRIFYVKE